MALTTARGLGRKLNAALLHGAFWTLLVGSLLAAYAIFTRIAPACSTPFIRRSRRTGHSTWGSTLVVVSTWLTSAALFAALHGWRKEHPGERIPLLAYMSIVTYVMWDIASLGIAIEVVVFLLPWSLGLLHGQRSSAQPDAVLVHRPSDRLLLAAAGLCFVVRDGAEAGGRQAVQRPADANRLPDVSLFVDSGRLSPSVQRPGNLADDEVTSVAVLTFASFLPQPDDRVLR